MPKQIYVVTIPQHPQHSFTSSNTTPPGESIKTLTTPNGRPGLVHNLSRFSDTIMWHQSLTDYVPIL